MNDMVEVFNRYHFLLIVKIDLTTDAKFTMKKCAVSFQNVTTDIIFLLTNFRAVLCRAELKKNMNQLQSVNKSRFSMGGVPNAKTSPGLEVI